MIQKYSTRGCPGETSPRLATLTTSTLHVMSQNLAEKRRTEYQDIGFPLISLLYGKERGTLPY